MQIRLKSDKVFRNTVEGVYVEIGGELVEVDDKVGEYLLLSFPTMLELASPKKKLVKESKEV